MKGKLSKIFTVLLVLYPMIYVYDSPIGPFCLADTLLLIIYPFLFLSLFMYGYVKIDKLQLSLMFFVLLNVGAISLLEISGLNAVLTNQGHFILVLITLALVVPNLYEKKLGTKLLCYASVISSLYLILQVILLHVFNITIGAHVPFLTANISGNGHIRPFAFFAEPAGFGMFNAVGLATIILQKPFRDKVNRIMEMVVTFAMLVSLSSTSIALLAIIWGGVLIPVLCKRRSSFLVNPIVIIDVLAVIVLFIVANSRMNIVSRIYDHVVPVSGSGMAGGVYNRLGNIFTLHQDYSFGIYEIIFGHGMVDIISFLPGVVRAYLYFGLVGCGVLILYFLILYKASRRYGRLLLVVVMANSLFGDPIFGLGMFGYMQYIITDCMNGESMETNSILKPELEKYEKGNCLFVNE